MGPEPGRGCTARLLLHGLQRRLEPRHLGGLLGSGLFLVADLLCAEVLGERKQHVNGFSAADDQITAPLLQRSPQVFEGFEEKPRPMRANLREAKAGGGEEARREDGDREQPVCMRGDRRLSLSGAAGGAPSVPPPAVKSAGLSLTRRSFRNQMIRVMPVRPQRLPRTQRL